MGVYEEKFRMSMKHGMSVKSESRVEKNVDENDRLYQVDFKH